MRRLLGTLSAVVLFCSFSPGNAATQDTLHVGSEILDGAVPFLGTTSIESFKLHQGVRTPVSRSIQTIERAVEDDFPVYRVTIIHWAAGRGDSAITTVVVRQQDFALLRHKVKANLDSAVVLYSQGFLSGWVVLPNTPILLIDMETSHPVFPVDGPAPWLLSALPLRENFAIVIPRYSMWEKGARNEALKVIGTETLERHGKPVECWKVDNGPFAIPGYRAYRWVDKQTKKILQTVLRGKPDEPEYRSIAE
ncbi:MAG: hypothetical protein HYZ01_12325 [Ignavibacteriales bacterium]|nr:hypothetical protein [Ignavibacteriales bacterium]